MIFSLQLPFNLALFRPGMRVAVAVSGGADSVALLRALLAGCRKTGYPGLQSLGIVLSVVHVHHGIRGAEADADADFVSELACRYELPFHLHRVDTPAAVSARHETIEEAARRLRYGCFDSLFAADQAEAVATAHTLDDQAETVIHRFVRGAWTEGLGAIHPLVQASGVQTRGGVYLRPLLRVRRSEVEAYLTALEQPWRADSSNADPAFTRNRIRRELMPLLRTYNPQVDRQLANLSAIARDEDAYWNTELERLLPSLLLPGKPVRGGGRAAGTGRAAGAGVVLAIEIERLRALPAALRRRVVRAAAARLDHSLSFDHTEALLSMCGLDDTAKIQPQIQKVTSDLAKLPNSKATRRPGGLDLCGDIRVVRTPRELQFTRCVAEPPPSAEYLLPIPGAVRAEDYGLVFRASISPSSILSESERLAPAVIRATRPSDRVVLRHSSGRKTMKEVLERLHLSAPERARWPLVEWREEVIWLRGAQVDSTAADRAGLVLAVRDLAAETA